MGNETITEPSRQTPVYGEFDVVVVGGGPAGIMAAAAAARAGGTALLIERYGFLGGAGTAGGLSTFCGLHARTYGQHVRVIRGLADTENFDLSLPLWFITLLSLSLAEAALRSEAGTTDGARREPAGLHVGDAMRGYVS